LRTLIVLTSTLPERWCTKREFTSLKAGSLDEASGLRLVAHRWVCRKQPWLQIDHDLPAFETQPDDPGGWRAGLLGPAIA